MLLANDSCEHASGRGYQKLQVLVFISFEVGSRKE